MKGWMTVPEAGEYLKTHPERLREAAFREEDPFPIIIPPWNAKDGRVPIADMDEWMLRNSKPWKEKHAER